jgi:hypothetical protein
MCRAERARWADIAQVLGGVSISILVLFAGLFVTPQRVPAGWIGLYYADPLSHILRALATNEVGAENCKRYSCRRSECADPLLPRLVAVLVRRACLPADQRAGRRRGGAMGLRAAIPGHQRDN